MSRVLQYIVPVRLRLTILFLALSSSAWAGDYKEYLPKSLNEAFRNFETRLVETPIKHPLSDIELDAGVLEKYLDDVFLFSRGTPQHEDNLAALALLISQRAQSPGQDEEWLPLYQSLLDDVQAETQASFKTSNPMYQSLSYEIAPLVSKSGSSFGGYWKSEGKLAFYSLREGLMQILAAKDWYGTRLSNFVSGTPIDPSISVLNADPEAHRRADQARAASSYYADRIKQNLKYKWVSVPADMAQAIVAAIPNMIVSLPKDGSHLLAMLAYDPVGTTKEQVRGFFFPIEAAAGAKEGAFSNFYILMINYADAGVSTILQKPSQTQLAEAEKILREMKSMPNESLANFSQADLKYLAVMIAVSKVPIGGKTEPRSFYGKTDLRMGKFEGIRLKLAEFARSSLGRESLSAAEQDAITGYLTMLRRESKGSETRTSMSPITIFYRNIFPSLVTQARMGANVISDVFNLGKLLERKQTVLNVGCGARCWDARMLERYPNFQKIVSVDLDESVKGLTVDAAEAFGVAHRQKVIIGDFLDREAMTPQIGAPADLVVMNNPNHVMQMLYPDFLKEMDYYLAPKGHLVIFGDGRFNIYDDLVDLYGEENVAVYLAEDQLVDAYLPAQLQPPDRALMYLVQKPTASTADLSTAHPYMH